MWRQNNRQQTIVNKWVSNNKYTAYLYIFDKSGDYKTFIFIVALEEMWLDTTSLLEASYFE